jgi:hypothetical protein
MALCPNCRHEASRHDASNQCGEPGCACIFDPKGAVAFAGTADLSSVRPTSVRARSGRSLIRLALDHPIASLVVMSFAAMAVTMGIEQLEKGPPTILWLQRHHASVALVKQVLCMIAIPGLLIIMFWSPGMKAKDMNKPAPRVLPVLLGFLVAAFLLYYASKLFLAAR